MPLLRRPLPTDWLKAGLDSVNTFYPVQETGFFLCMGFSLVGWLDKQDGRALPAAVAGNPARQPGQRVFLTVDRSRQVPRAHPF